MKTAGRKLKSVLIYIFLGRKLFDFKQLDCKLPINTSCQIQVIGEDIFCLMCLKKQIFHHLNKFIQGVLGCSQYF